MNIYPYLFFKGNCAEAFDHYASAFGTKPSFSQTFGDGPEEVAASAEDRTRIMHISLPMGDGALMGSDVMSSTDSEIEIGNNARISITVDSRESADHAFNALGEGGEVNMPIHDAFWGAYFGVVEDRYGVIWMISYDQRGSG